MSALYKKLGAFDLPADSTDAARYLQLPTGGYTFQVSGRSDGTGVALIESYLVRPDPKLFP
jgi:hypothetical protein